MTKEEAVKILKKVYRWSLDWGDEGREDEALELAISVLQNAPLTLEELKTMENEPVWVKVLDHEVFADKNDDFDGWGMCRKSWVRIWDGSRADLIHIDYHFEDYGKEWIAYRHKPET